MRRFVILGRTATSSPSFSTEDLPSTSGRLDVLLRCLRAGLLVSHGVRSDTLVYLVLLGGEHAPRALRFEGKEARFLRPDERSLAILVRKVLAVPASDSFTEVRPGVSMAAGGLEVVLGDLPPGRKYLLEQGAPDIRTEILSEPEITFFIGDHLGVDASTRETLAKLGVTPAGLGPVGLHAEDAVTVVCNELDRRVLT
jgi:tRNA (pseudouridine54-N1)-methyltransferase